MVSLISGLKCRKLLNRGVLNRRDHCITFSDFIKNLDFLEAAIILENKNFYRRTINTIPLRCMGEGGELKIFTHTHATHPTPHPHRHISFTFKAPYNIFQFFSWYNMSCAALIVLYPTISYYHRYNFSWALAVPSQQYTSFISPPPFI